MNTRKLSGALLAMLAALQWGHAFAQKNNLTLVEGTITRAHATKAFLYSVHEGDMVEIAQARLGEKGGFGFIVPEVKEGFYYVGTNLYPKLQTTRVYLKPGDNIHLEVNDSTTTVTGGGEEEKTLAQWQQMSAEVMRIGVEFFADRFGYVKYFPALEDLVPKAEAFKQKIHTKNPAFDAYMRWLVQNDLEYASISLLYTPRSAHPQKEERPDFYNHIIRPDNYADTRVLQLGDGERRVSFYDQFVLSTKTITKDNLFQLQMDAIPNDTLKGLLVVRHSQGFKSLEAAQEAMKPYTQYLVTDSMRAQYNRALSSIATFKSGEKAFEFNFTDNNGKMVALKDFRGKAVYIDTWATWCAPCRAELPHLKKLEEAYKDDKRIAFVSISIDEEKDTQKWLDFIKKEELGGTQLHVNGWNNDYIKYYKINGIPRFLLIDQQGNIVSADAPRPSSGEELNALLKKTIDKKS